MTFSSHDYEHFFQASGQLKLSSASKLTRQIYEVCVYHGSEEMLMIEGPTLTLLAR